jgi:ATP-binding cassette subfamily B protein
MINLFQRGTAGIERLFELLEHEPEIADEPAPGAPERLDGGLEVRGLTYRYEGGSRPALEDVSFRAEPGQCLGILGRVGSGKSTLLRLLVRTLDPAPGTILLDGHDVRTLRLGAVREQVALMPQEPFLFSDTLAANLAYDDPERPREQTQSAAGAADLAETLAGLPDGLDTPVGERGVMLSGGQKQRLTLARALVREAPVLLLDDPFSSVDSETEERILAHLAKRPGTTVLVSHRVASVRAADLILVLEEGRVAEQGSHSELLARDGVYARMARVQSRNSELLARLDRIGATGGGGAS